MVAKTIYLFILRDKYLTSVSVFDVLDNVDLFVKKNKYKR